MLGARSEDKLAALAEELGGAERAIAVRCDVTEWEDRTRRIAAAALDAFGRIDAVFANAGFGAKRGFLEESPEHWRSMVLTNVLGVALTIRATLPHLLERGTGHFVITSSVAGRRALPGSLYSATKWAVTAIGEALRAELRQMHENQRDPRDADRAGDGRHRRSSTSARQNALARRRHRPRRRSTPSPSRRTSTSTRS